MTYGTPVKIPDIFRAPEAKEDEAQTRKQKQGARNEDDIKS